MRLTYILSFFSILLLIFLLLGFSHSPLAAHAQSSKEDEGLVEFGKIVAENKGNRIILIKWVTLKEYDSFKFVVERSEDNINFSTIGAIGATNESSIPINYNFSDLDPSNGYSYYRIRAVNKLGRGEYSKVISVYYDPQSMGLQLIEASPNPFVDSVNISYQTEEAGTLYMRLLSDKGEEIFFQEQRIEKGKHNLVLAPKDLPNGRYVLGLMGSDRVLKAVELLKK